MEITILSIFCNRPDFIKPQFDSMKRHLKDNFKYVVVNNSYFSDSQPQAIEKESQKENTGYIRVHHKDGKTDICVVVRDTLNFLWKKFKKTKGILAIIDCDVFLIQDVSFEKLLDGYDMAFCPLYTAGKVWPWTGLMLLNMNKIKVEDVSFNFESLDKKTYQDVGSALSNYIEKHNPKIKLLKRNEILDEPDEALESYGFPHPYSVDVVSDEYPFIFHYKTSSNYAPHCTPGYNEKKTLALNKLLL